MTGRTELRVSYVDVDLTESTSTGGLVDGGDWSFVGLAGADLRSASFIDVRMREADLSGVLGTGMTLQRVDLAGTTFAKASLDQADLRGCDLSTLDPMTVSLRGTIIDWSQAIVLAAAYGLDVRPE
jgi:uncharacterized protein YjbI with pentapeptide repeats